MRLLALVPLLVVACAQDFSERQSCMTDHDCRTAERLGTLFSDASPPEFLPVCCNQICVVPSGGCEDGYRYLTTDPGYGACVIDPMCPAPTVFDMSMPVTSDLAKATHD